MKKTILALGLVSLFGMNAFASVYIRYYNKDSQVWTFKVKMDGQNKEVTFNGSTSGAATIGGSGTKAIVRSLASLPVEDHLDLVLAGVPFIEGFSGEVDTALALFCRVAGRDDLGVGFDAGDRDRDEIHLDRHRLVRIELDDTIDRDVGREKARDHISQPSVAVILGKEKLLDAPAV